MSSNDNESLDGSVPLQGQSDNEDWPDSPNKRRKITSSNEFDGAKPSGKTLSHEAINASGPVSRIRARQNGASKGAISSATVEARSTESAKLDQTNFANINVHPWLVSSLAAMAITRPTSIQKSCIPEILKGRDCIGGSRTGSGKTVAFAVPILQKWAEDPVGIYAVILTPTRELALQIFEQFKAISAPQNLKPLLITGGADMRAQALALAQRPHIVIATPGRLADHVNVSGEDTICGLRRAKFVVLDEADRLLAAGPGSMLPDVGTCLSVLPPSGERQTLLFTATVTGEVRALKEQPRPKGKPPLYICEIGDLGEPTVPVDNNADEPGTTISPAPAPLQIIPSTLSQRYILTPVTHRETYLHVLLSTAQNSPPDRSAIIFTNRTSTATYLEHVLRLLSHRVTSLHSALPQHQRTSNLARFRASAAKILVATDVAARGLDIPAVAMVLNYDIPRDPDDYVHRVGRTARAGRAGTSVTFVGQRDVELVAAIEERVGRRMEEYEEEGVNVEGRVARGEVLKAVGVAKREALLRIEEGKDVGGRRKRGLKVGR